MIKVNLEYTGLNNLDQYASQLQTLTQQLHLKEGKGCDFLGWVQRPFEVSKGELEAIKKAAKQINETADILVVVGIGGSYLGSRAAIEMIRGLYGSQDLEIIFMGHTFSSHYVNQVLTYLKGKNFAINVISKSGTTTETAIAFRLLKQLAENHYGKVAAKQYIYVTTDANKGILNHIAKKEGYPMFTIPDDVGGRYSVLTAVGLLPIAAAGIDIEDMLKGAQDAIKACDNLDFNINPAFQYAAARHALYLKGYAAEMFVTYDPHMCMFAEWWKQLFGESEGKSGKGLLPTSANFSTDLHSLGQFIQEGKKVLFETLCVVTTPQSDITLPQLEEDDDQLNYLAHKTLDFVNKKACEGTLAAHVEEGGVPNIIIEVESLTPYSFGYLAYFFMRACALSVYMLDENPFDQPGVEVYKRNMFSLLGKK